MNNTTQSVPVADTYTKQWLALALILACIGVGAYVQRDAHPVVPLPPIATPVGVAEVDWYMALRFPEITTQYETDIETMRNRLEDWLIALRAAGFQPMLWSEVLNRLEKGQKLPPRTIVLTFSPGYRRTAEIAEPVLARQQTPAVLLTPEAALDHGDRRYATYHLTQQMRKSGLWDVGLLRRNGQIELLPAQGKTRILGEKKRDPWSVTAGASALNKGPASSELRYLTITNNLLAPELVARLAAEAPVETPVALTTDLIESQQWGVVAHSVATGLATPSFRIATPVQRRGSRVYWLSTKGQTSFSIHLEVDRIKGNLSVNLASDPATKQKTRIVFSGNRVSVQDVPGDAGPIHTLAMATLPGRRSGPQLTADIALYNGNLIIRSADQRVVELVLPRPVSTEGVLELYAYDRLFGAALAEGVRMTFTPQ